MTLYDLANQGIYSYLNGVVSTGKESRVYWGVTSEAKDLAVKIYIVASSDFKRRAQYVIGDPRFSNFRKDSRSIAELWARKEYTNLKQAFEAGVPAPRPIQYAGNVLVMEFIGENGVSAPKLLDTEVTKKDYLAVIAALKTLFSKAELVHADLSEYNIFKFNQKIVLFDFGSAVSSKHPTAIEFLKRDLTNLNRFFTKRGINTIPEEKLLSKIAKVKKQSPEEEYGIGEEEENRIV